MEIQAILAGDRLALARALTQVENDTPEGRAILNGIFPYTGRAHLIGITGAPGTGKSSLAGQLALAFRNPPSGLEPQRVAIVAIDPSSPFTGGALLGDRIRMRQTSGDTGVFIRSMASRGALGGLARATASVVQVFDAAGYGIILIETVGAGQSEVDIARLAHTTLVVEAPGLGDDIQAIKAGILEIADILVVNKADQPGIENTFRALRSMLEMAAHPHEMEQPTWQVPIYRSVASLGEGIPEIAAAIRTHAQHLRENGQWAQRDLIRLKKELDEWFQAALVQRWQAGAPSALYPSVLENLLQRQISPYQAVERLLNASNFGEEK